MNDIGIDIEEIYQHTKRQIEQNPDGYTLTGGVAASIGRLKQGAQDKATYRAALQRTRARLKKLERQGRLTSDVDPETRHRRWRLPD